MTKSQSQKSLVLYADDDPDDIELIQESFTSYSKNIDLITFPDGVQLLNHIETIDHFDPLPCLIILDVNMPRLDGKEVLKKLRNIEDLKDIPVVLFTTSSLPADQSFATHYNAGFITKPLDSRQMSKIVEQFIDHCPDETKNKIRKK